MFSYFELRKLRKSVKELTLAVRRRLVSDDDILSDKQKESLKAVLAEAEALSRKDADAMKQFLSRNSSRVDSLMAVHGNMRKLRNFLDVLAVAFAVAFGVRALYLQPFKIPTSSMQPTLFGIHYVDREGLNEFGGPISGTMLPLFSPRAKLEIREDGELTAYDTHSKYLFDTETSLQIGNRIYNLPGSISNVARYVDLQREGYRKGELLCDGWLSTGDHLFVDRLSIHFLPLKRGDVIVFTTENIKSPTQPLGGYYYIKRLVGLPGDTLKIVDNILYIKPEGETEFKPATAFSDKFNRVYSFEGGYQGHIASELLAPGLELKVPKDMFFALGDNTSNSLDGRNWGFIPRKNMIGRGLNVFWPISRRWGLVDRLPPLDTPTVLPSDPRYQPSAMSMQ